MDKKHLHKKHSIQTIMFILLIGAVGVMKGYAYDFEYGGLYYRITSGVSSNRTVCVTYPGSSWTNPWPSNFTKPVGDLSIPNKVVYDGNIYSVTSIDSDAFKDCNGITTVSTYDSLKSIGSNAFLRCSGLLSISIGRYVNSIEYDSFDGCTSLEQITVNALNYKYDSRDDCNAIIVKNTKQLLLGCKNTTIPNTVVSIGNDAFKGCNGLTEITIPNSVQTIGEYAFYNCTGLTSVTIGNSVTSIGIWAFSGCNSLSSIVIPQSVTSIGKCAFSYCLGLEHMVVETGNTIYDSRENCNAIIETNTNTFFAGCKSSVIPSTVTTIGVQAFYGCKGLTSITIDNSVDVIGSLAFYSSDLCSVTIGNSVESIGDNAFSFCYNLIDVTIGNSVNSIGNRAFYSIKSNASIVLFPTTVPTLGTSAFDNTSKIYVPFQSRSAYSIAENWNNYSIYSWLQKTIAGYGTGNDKWTFIASPVKTDIDPTSIDGLIAETAAEYDLYRLNPSAENEWENYKVHTADFVFKNGQGYLYANKYDITLMIKGAIFDNASKNVTLQTGWNLVGNPYGQDAYINRSYYRMNSAGDDIEAVSAYTTTQIPVCTGVVVQGASDSDFVRFTKTTPTKSTGNGSLQMTLAKTGSRGSDIQDKAIVSFDEDTQLGKFIFNEDNAKLYVPQNGEDYAIAYSNGQDDMPLYFKTKETGTYTINFENNSELKDACLVDKFKNKIIDLCESDSYTFIGSAVDRPDRFVIRFKNSELSDNSENSYFAYQNGNEIIINGNGELQVFDVMGRSVITQHVNGVETMGTSSLSTGVYIFRLNEKTQKILVR